MKTENTTPTHAPTTSARPASCAASQEELTQTEEMKEDRSMSNTLERLRASKMEADMPGSSESWSYVQMPWR